MRRLFSEVTMKSYAQKLLTLNDLSCAELSVHQFHDAAMNKAYDVYRIHTEDGQYVMKSGKREFDNYHRWFQNRTPNIPYIYPQALEEGKDTWFLMEYLPGKDLRDAAPETVLTAAEALARLHRRYWNEHPTVSPEERYSGYYRRFISRFPEAPELQQTLEALIARMRTCPRTLIHDDLLPINVQATDRGLYFMDWQYCGEFPYFMDICRLLVHEKGELGSSFSPQLRERAFRVYFDTLTESGRTSLTWETFQNDIRLGTIAELVSCLQQEDRSQWKDFLWDYYHTIVELSK